jgi:hypothetical protein
MFTMGEESLVGECLIIVGNIGDFACCLLAGAASQREF